MHLAELAIEGNERFATTLNKVRMKRKVIITCAVTGSIHTPTMSPHLPITPSDIAASNFLADNAYGFLPLPIIIPDPAVDGGLGMAGLFFHESDEQKAKRLEALRDAEDGARFLGSDIEYQLTSFSELNHLPRSGRDGFGILNLIHR